MCKKIFVSACSALALFASTSAWADDKSSCADAYEKAQTLRDGNQFVRAREQLRICARPACTRFIARDCTAWLVEIEPRIPSVVFFAKDAAGTDLSNVTVSMDGAVLTQQLDGHAIEVDAGKHTFTFALPDGKQLDQTYVVLEGQKAQRVGVTAPPSAPPGAGDGNSREATKPVVPLPPADDSGGAPSSWSGRKTLSLAVVGAGLAGVAVGTVFGLKAMSSSNDQKSACSSSTCGDSNRQQAISDHTDAANAATISTIAFAAGGTLVATGVVLFLTAPRSEAPAQEKPLTGLHLAPVAGPSGAGVWLRGSF
jgi:hypothetical protein